MPGHDIICIGASAGGVEALLSIARALPANLPASVFAVLHVSPYARSMMPELLNRAGPLPAAHAMHGEAILPGRLYVAPPDHHLVVNRGGVAVTRGPQENGVRPAVDVTFRSAANAFHNRVVGVVLTGNLDDGTAGLVAIKRMGGVAVVQNPDEAMYPGMPTSAVQNVEVDYIVPLAEIPPLLVRLANEPVEEVMPSVPDDRMSFEAEVAKLTAEAIHDQDRPGTPSVFACPDCHGSLFEIKDGELVRFRCRVGHAYSPESLLAAQSNGVEAALWTALRALEEKVALCRRMVARAVDRGHHASGVQFQRQAEEVEGQAEVLRRVLAEGNGELTGTIPTVTSATRGPAGVATPPSKPSINTTGDQP